MAEPGDSVRRTDRMSDEAVRARTGKDWEAWMAILDAAGAAAMTHKEIVAVLARDHAVGPWWQQMVAVTYEKERGLRRAHEKTGGFEISRTRTVRARISELYGLCCDESSLRSWLKEPEVSIRTSTPERTVRFNFRGTIVEIRLVDKGERGTALTVQQMKLESAAQAEEMKIYWGEKLEQLAAPFEG